jgi:RNA polymerase sporulation-specific sigma factor
MKYQNINDYELLSEVADNEQATEALFIKYRPLIIGIAKKTYYMNQNTGLEINDLIQEGMIGFSIALNTFNDNKDAKFFTYAKTCIERRIISAVVSAKRMKHQILNESISMENLNVENGLLDKAFTDESRNPEKVLIQDENTKELANNIKEKLTDFETEVFELKASGFNYKEIAEILNKDDKSIDNAIHRIKSKVQKYLNE